MFRNRSDRTDSLEGTAITPLHRLKWLAALRSIIFNVVFFITFPIWLIINIPTLFGKQASYFFSKYSGVYTLWLVKVICGLDCRVVGMENVPTGPCVLASKHQSAWDTFVFLVFFPSAAYVSKKELERIPLYGSYIRKHKNISIDRKRGRKSLTDLREQAQALVQDGRKIVLFPEGSRTVPGTREPYQKGILALYKDLDCPIIPVALNSGVFWGRRSWIKWPGVITLEFLPAMPKGLESADFMEQLADRIDTASEKLVPKQEEVS